MNADRKASQKVPETPLLLGEGRLERVAERNYLKMFQTIGRMVGAV
jgi:hypothetical protein